MERDRTLKTTGEMVPPRYHAVTSLTCGRLSTREQKERKRKREREREKEKERGESRERAEREKKKNT